MECGSPAADFLTNPPNSVPALYSPPLNSPGASVFADFFIDKK